MKPKNDCQSTEENMVGGTKEWEKKTEPWKRQGV